VVDGVCSIPLAGEIFISKGGKNHDPQGGIPISLRTFYAGPENALVAEAVRRLLAGESPYTYSPLLIVGPEGVGKSHLARGLARRFEAQSGLLPVAYAEGQEFAKDYAQAVAADSVAGFRQRLRAVRLLILDEIRPLTEKLPAQWELLFILDALADQGGVAVVTSRKPLHTIEGLLPRLVNRLTGGLRVSLSPPAASTRYAVLREIAIQRGIALSATAAEALAEHLDGTVPAAVDALLEMSEADPVIDAATATRYLKRRSLRRTPAVNTIVKMTAKKFSVRIAQLRSESRNRTVVAARRIAMYLARSLTGQSLEKIGKALGGRDHTTVLYNCRKVETLLRTDPETCQIVQDLKQNLQSATQAE